MRYLILSLFAITSFQLLIRSSQLTIGLHKSVASSDARNIQTVIRQEGDEIVISGHKWVRQQLAPCGHLPSLMCRT